MGQGARFLHELTVAHVGNPPKVEATAVSSVEKQIFIAALTETKITLMVFNVGEPEVAAISDRKRGCASLPDHQG